MSGLRGQCEQFVARFVGGASVNSDCPQRVRLMKETASSAPDCRRADMVLFNQNPPAELEKFPPRAYGPDLCGENLVEEIKQALLAEKFVGPVIVKNGLP